MAKKFKWALIAACLLALVPMAAAIAASVYDLTIWDVIIGNSDCDMTGDVHYLYEDVISEIQRTYIRYGDGAQIDSDTFISYVSGSGSYNTTFGLGAGEIPGPYTECGLKLEIRADGELVATATYGVVPSESYTPWFYTQPSAGELVTGNHQTILYNSVEACGIFEAGWYGRKYLTPENFPDCAGFLPAGVEVACMNEEAVWTADNVTGSGVSEGVFYAIVEQHGTCGIFPVG